MHKQMKKVLCIGILALLIIGCSESSQNKAEVVDSSVEFQSEGFQELLSKEKILYYQKDGDELKITMKEKVDNDVKITATLLNKKAEPMYDEKADIQITYQRKNNVIQFPVEATSLYALSSDSQIKENAYIGYTVFSESQNKIWHLLVGLKK